MRDQELYDLSERIEKGTLQDGDRALCRQVIRQLISIQQDIKNAKTLISEMAVLEQNIGALKALSAATTPKHKLT